MGNNLGTIYLDTITNSFKVVTGPENAVEIIRVDHETLDEIKKNKERREMAINNIKLGYEDLLKYNTNVNHQNSVTPIEIDATNGENNIKDSKTTTDQSESEAQNSLVNVSTIPYIETVKDFPNTDLKIRYHREYFPNLPDIKKMGNFIDLYNAQDVELKKGQFVLLNLGVSVEIPKGYWMQIVPRSSTFKKYGIIQTNSFGVIDDTYCGDNDILMLPVYAVRDTLIPANERVCQFTLHKEEVFNIVEVPILTGANRGGFGSTGSE